VITGYNTDVEFDGVVYHVQTEDKGLQTPVMKERFDKLGVEPLTMTPEAFDARIAQEAKIAVELAVATGLANSQ